MDIESLCQNAYREVVSLCATPYASPIYQRKTDFSRRLIRNRLLSKEKLSHTVNRQPIDIFINPAHLPAEMVATEMCRAAGKWRKEQGPYEELFDGFLDRDSQADYGIEERGVYHSEFQRSIEDDPEGSAICLSAQIFAVATIQAARHQPVGYLTLNFSLTIRPEEKSIFYMMEPYYSWLSPEYRGLGIGHDLAYAGGEVLADLYKRIAVLTHNGWRIDAVIYADIISPGGERASEVFCALLHRTWRKLRAGHGKGLSKIDEDIGW